MLDVPKGSLSRQGNKNLFLNLGGKASGDFLDSNSNICPVIALEALGGLIGDWLNSSF